jgi:hypothetical protein
MGRVWLNLAFKLGRKVGKDQALVRQHQTLTDT